MVQIRRIDPEDFDWSGEEGPAAEVRRVARASTAHDGATTLNEQALLELKNRGLRDASLWLGGGGFALRHREVLDLAVHPEPVARAWPRPWGPRRCPRGTRSRPGRTATTPAPPGWPSSSGSPASVSWR